MKIAPYQIESFIDKISSNQNIFGAVIYGPESGLISIRAKKIAKAITVDLADPFLVTNLSSAKIESDKAILIDEFSSITMLGGRKLISVHDGNNKITDSLKLVFADNQKPVGENFILIIAGDLDKTSSLRKLSESNPYLASIACYEDDSATIANLVRQKIREYNLNFEDGVMDLILSKFGKNRLVILNEIEKLALFMSSEKGDKKNVTLEIANQVISDISQASISELITAFADSDIENSLLILNRLFAEKIAAIVLIRSISGYFLKLQVVKINLQNGGNLESEVKAQRLFFKQEVFFKKHVNQWNLPALNEVLLKLQELEVRCKSSNSNPELFLASFINFACLKYR